MNNHDGCDQEEDNTMIQREENGWGEIIDKIPINIKVLNVYLQYNKRYLMDFQGENAYKLIYLGGFFLIDGESD